MRFSRLIAISATLLLSLTRGFSFPAEPMSLQALIERSDVVLHGKVLKVLGDHTKQIEKVARQFPATDPELRKMRDNMIALLNEMGPTTGTATAEVSVIKVLKGKPGNTVSIEYNAGMICPTPPQFPLAADVILFLQRSRGGKFETVGLGQGSIRVTQAEADVFANRISEYLDLTLEPNESDRTRRTVDWLVKLVEHPVTRWFGAAELTDRKSFHGKDIPAAFGKELTVDQIGRMKLAVLKSKEITDGDRAILKLVAKQEPLLVARHVIAYLKSATEVGPAPAAGNDWFESPWEICDSLFFLAELGGDLERFEEIMHGIVRTSFMQGAATRAELTKRFLPEAMRGVRSKAWWSEDSSN